MSYNKIKIHKDAFKFLKELDEKIRKRIKEKIEILKYFPKIGRRIDIERLKGLKNAYRLRVGRIRIYFEYFEKERIIYIRKIEFRGRIYKKL